MAKPGRSKTAIQLTVGNDPSLHKYGSLAEALHKNIAFIAELIDPALLMTDCLDESDPSPVSEELPKKRKSRKK